MLLAFGRITTRWQILGKLLYVEITKQFFIWEYVGDPGEGNLTLPVSPFLF